MNGACVSQAVTPSPTSSPTQEAQVGVCANWFGGSVDWGQISTATRFGNTPWGIMTANKCDTARTKDQCSGCNYYCAVHEPNGGFTTCGGDCMNGACVSQATSSPTTEAPTQAQVGVCANW